MQPGAHTLVQRHALAPARADTAVRLADHWRAIGALPHDLPILHAAQKAYLAVRNGQRFRYDSNSERSRRLMWTALVDRYLLRPDTVAKLVIGPAPSKSYVRLLETWASRPEDPRRDVHFHSPERTSIAANDWYALVGMCGSGKTAVGARLARRLGLEHVNLDDEVERRHGRALSDMFAELGSLQTLQAYRDAVDVWISEGQERRGLVVSFGAGSVLLPEVNAIARACRNSIWLAAPPRTIMERLASDTAHSAHAFSAREYYPLVTYVQIVRAPVYAAASRWVQATGPLAELVETLAAREDLRK